PGRARTSRRCSMPARTVPAARPSWRWARARPGSKGSRGRGAPGVPGSSPAAGTPPPGPPGTRPRPPRARGAGPAPAAPRRVRKLVGPAFLDRFAGRFVNTHPSLLPAFPGMHAVRDALAYGVKVTGCTVFLVDAGTDTGPVIAQAAVPVREDDGEASLHERIKVTERALLVDTVGRMVRDGWSVEGRTVRVGQAADRAARNRVSPSPARPVP